MECLLKVSRHRLIDCSVASRSFSFSGTMLGRPTAIKAFRVPKMHRVTNKKLERMITLDKGSLFQDAEDMWKGRRLQMHQKSLKQVTIIMQDSIMGFIDSGGIHQELTKIGFQVCKIKIPPDLTRVSIYWMAASKSTDETTEALLRDTSLDLRMHLDGCGMFGTVPPIQFIKDVSRSCTIDVEELLEQADMGSDDEHSVCADDGIKQHSVNVLSDLHNSAERDGGVKRIIYSDDCDDDADVDEVEMEKEGDTAVNHVNVVRQLDQEYRDHTAAQTLQSLGYGDINMRDDVYDVDHGVVMKRLAVLMAGKKKLRERKTMEEFAKEFDKIALERMMRSNKEKVKKRLTISKHAKSKLLASQYHAIEKGDKS